MKKILSILIASAILVSSVFAANGIMSGEKNLKVAETQWFDIVYPPECEETAAIFFKNADQVYKEVNEQYGLEPSFRMPLVLTPAVEEFNAYWTNYPYNHVVIYDTGVIDELEVFSKTLLQTFRHELTHAVTYNMKDPFFRFLGKVFGDTAYFPQWLVSSGMSEGATVASESVGGEGRLNDEYAKQYVKQAKIEGSFPSYYDVQGASDIRPYGDYYYFNGAFHQWIQQKYGMEKYAQFWYKAVNLRGFTIGQVYKKVYGVSVKTDWNEFYTQYKVPEIPANPVSSGIAKDFFAPSTADYSDLNKKGEIFTSLTAGSKGIAYLDSSNGTAYLVPSEKLSESTLNPEKLFTLSRAQAINLSADGKLMAVDYLEVQDSLYKKQVKIFNLENNSFYSLNENGMQNSAVLENEGNYYLVVQNFVSQKNSINIYKINFNGEKITSTEPVKKIALPVENIPYGFMDLGNGKFAYIERAAMSYSICLSSLESDTVTKYAVPDGYCVRTPSFSDGRILFSYTKTDSMPRAASFTVSSGTFEFDSRDISGGVYYPVKNGDKISYIGTFYRCNRILTIENQDGETVRGKAVTVKVSDKAEVNPLYPELENDVADLKEASKKYNPFSFYKRGILIPYSQIQSVSYDQNHSGGDYTLPYGLTYISGNPWTDGIVQLAAGYGYRTKSFGMAATYTENGFISSKTDLSVEFDGDGFKQFNGESYLATAFYFGKSSSITVANDAIYHYGRSNDVVTVDSSLSEWDAFIQENTASVVSADKTNYQFGQEQFSLLYSNVHKTGANRYNLGGFTLESSVYTYFNQDGPDVKEDTHGHSDVYFAGLVYIPQLIPVTNTWGQTSNLPVKLGVSLFASLKQSSTLSYDYFKIAESGLNFMGEAVLYGKEIQKSFPIFYCDDVKVSFVYKGGFSLPASLYGKDFKVAYLPEYFNAIVNNQTYYSEAYYLKASLGLTFNQGAFASSDYKFYITGRAGAYNITGTPVFYGDLGFDIAF